VRVVIDEGMPAQLRHHPTHTGLAITCPECGLTEAFNTALLPRDEDHTRPGNYHHRAEQARLIRTLQRHGAIGLAVLE
jgi:uncharacterized protein (DUF983 family)